MIGIGVRKTLSALALVAAVLFVGTVIAGEEGFKELFNGKSMDGFKFNIFGDGQPNPFSVKDGAIHVVGKPAGYFYTDKSYKNYVLRFDWKFLEDGNSGLLVHIQGHGKSWPKSVEVQGQQSDHARIFGLNAKFDGLTTTGDKDKKAAGKKVVQDAQKKAIKKGDWNTTEVTCKDGEITSKINGILIDTGKGELKEGAIGWQSEGKPLLFKNIKIKVLD
jgi:hypothetical protein